MDTSNPLFYLLFKRDDDESSAPSQCPTENDFDGKTNLRILSIFIILISSALGAFFPILSSRYSFVRLPNWCFFIAKFFGSGVIVATAFIHLLQPANEALSNDCLGGTLAEYPWAFGICLMSLFLLFLVEIVSHYLIEGAFHEEESTVDDDKKLLDDSDNEDLADKGKVFVRDVKLNHNDVENKPEQQSKRVFTAIPGEGHYDHQKNHQDLSQIGTPLQEDDKENYSSQILAVLFLEFGIIFHSVFIGLSLAVSGDEFETLFIVLVFHQMFEGLGLGTRIAETNWPKSKRFTPWLMALAFSLTTPIAVAIGIGVRHSFIPGSRKALISNGVFDSISSGILIYTGLVELMAHEFLFSNEFKGREGFKKMVVAYIIMCCGTGLMALLGKWA
ncbi:uncharacterized protein PWA37_003506 [Arxiozyma heterogenica]|uniref:Uncharacterized protein n=1 Tax=Arxiozyma heterogenica TaxID=278026 RepID=A0AAN7WI33_9SACH|nr:hypothetical protein RI543_001975 [Kazachstania heterogenica]